MPRGWKPSPDHPWNRRAREGAARAEGKAKASRRRKEREVDVFEELLANEEAHDRIEASELERGIRDFFE